MSLDKRVEKNISSITNLKQLLIDVINNPESYLENEYLKKALISQGNLSKFEAKELNIYSTSINTMKRLSSYPNCDFESINKLRISALEKLSNKPIVDKKLTSNKNDLLVKIDNLENELNVNKSSQLLLLKTITEINKTLKVIKDLTNQEELKEHIDLIDKKIKKTMSLNTSFLLSDNDDNVISVNFNGRK